MSAIVSATVFYQPPLDQLVDTLSTKMYWHLMFKFAHLLTGMHVRELASLSPQQLSLMSLQNNKDIDIYVRYINEMNQLIYCFNFL